MAMTFLSGKGLMLPKPGELVNMEQRAEGLKLRGKVEEKRKNRKNRKED